MSCRWEPGGDASSQARNPVSAASVMASSTCSSASAASFGLSPGGLVHSSTTTCSGPSTFASAGRDGRRSSTVSDRRWKICSGRISTLSAPYQQSSSPW